MLGLSTKVASGAQALMEAATYETMDDNHNSANSSEPPSSKNFVRNEGADSDDDEV